jgi:hypothetical protein
MTERVMGSMLCGPFNVAETNQCRAFATGDIFDFLSECTISFHLISLLFKQSA